MEQDFLLILQVLLLMAIFHGKPRGLASSPPPKFCVAVL